MEKTTVLHDTCESGQQVACDIVSGSEILPYMGLEFSVGKLLEGVRMFGIVKSQVSL